MKIGSTYRRNFTPSEIKPESDTDCARIIKTTILEYGERQYVRSLKVRYPSVYEYIEHRFKTLDGRKFAEKCYWIVHGLAEFPKCPVCNKTITSFRNFKFGYAPTCSIECGNRYKLQKVISQPTTEAVTEYNDNKFRQQILSLKLNFNNASFISHMIAKAPEALNYVAFRYSILDGHCISEKLYWFLNQLTDFPKCPVYGKTVSSFRNIVHGYSENCPEHVQANPTVRWKKLNTWNRHVVENPNFLSGIDKKKRATKRAHGHDETWNNIEKAKQTRLKNHGTYWTDEMSGKTRKTLFENYGSETYNNGTLQAQTCIRKYGKRSYTQTDEYKALYKDEEFLNRRNTRMYQSKLKNKTFNTSRPEEESYSRLVKFFGTENVVRQYKSQDYPFQCDFYIKSENAYIECNFHWTHGYHWFDENNDADTANLAKLTEAADRLRRRNPNKPNLYEKAIEVWTIRDPMKLATATKNNLNYIVFWNFDELAQWIESKSKQ